MTVEAMYYNGYYCNHSLANEFTPLLIVFSCSGVVCGVLCIIAIAAMIFFRLFKLLTHRLILYMLVSVLFVSFIFAIQIIGLWLKFWQGKHKGECIAGSFLLEYSIWVMLLSTLIITVHLTSMVLFPTHYETVAKLEPFYLIFPWAFPLLIAWIPFIHNNYGISGAWCWIRLYNNDCSPNFEGLIEMDGVWYSELIIGLILNNIALIIIAVTLCKRACNKNETMLPEYRAALKQTLPLVAYPITYQLMSSFAIANRLYLATHKGEYIKWMFYAHAASGPWGYFAPIFTLIYIMTLRNVVKNKLSKLYRHCLCCKKLKPTVRFKDSARERLIDSSDHLTRYGITVTNPTDYDFGRESEIDEEYHRNY